MVVVDAQGLQWIMLFIASRTLMEHGADGCTLDVKGRRTHCPYHEEGRSAVLAV